ncbi:MerR family transcriptional regulator [Veronia pacifica]|uniref:HTH merR-type domain-containing protein n=1 Tax=Veronia pacifica TaxID=1080227 RepID=A0A1C3EL44_9GAMM|nr:MerR family transcriptional regulator [Veronia pacifica]ODA33952.1 hypothetical protein A8L45_07835 [Veronia pacifica]
MYIGEVSKKTGASIKAIRFYEKLGLLTDVARSGRYRIYNDTHIFLIQCIVQAKAQGFKLAEIKRALSYKDEQAPWLHILEMIEHKQQSLSEDIQRMQDQKKTLSELHAQIKRCLSDNPQCQLEDGI